MCLYHLFTVRAVSLLWLHAESREWSNHYRAGFVQYSGRRIDLRWFLGRMLVFHAVFIQ